MAEQAATHGDWTITSYIQHHMTNGQEWHPLPFLHINDLPSFVSQHAIMLVIASLILLVVFVGLYRRKDEVPRGLTNALEAFLLYIRDDICVPALGEKDGRRMAPLFCTFFFFILTLNLMGLVPLFATATANVNVTAGLATITFAFMVIGGIVVHGPIGFIKSFAPHGVPLPVVILLVPLEMMGLLIKCFALTMRLVANMMAGHIVIFALLGLMVMFKYYALPAVGLAVGIYFLEILVAFLQAYIFTLLSAIFIGQVYHPAH
jgi:F-type H+-transporting ATPase subunit a